jgi:hypothetical protein
MNVLKLLTCDIRFRDRLAYWLQKDCSACSISIAPVCIQQHDCCALMDTALCHHTLNCDASVPQDRVQVW